MNHKELGADFPLPLFCVRASSNMGDIVEFLKISCDRNGRFLKNVLAISERLDIMAKSKQSQREDKYVYYQ